MFRFHKTLDVITLFHKASLPASLRVHTLLKQVSASASAHATEDQASEHSKQSKPHRAQFELEVTEVPPTEDQLKSILEYIQPQKASTVVKGAKDDADAFKKLTASSDNFQWPVTVDWSNGKAVAGENESEILKMIEALPKN